MSCETFQPCGQVVGNRLTPLRHAVNGRGVDAEVVSQAALRPVQRGQAGAEAIGRHSGLSP